MDIDISTSHSSSSPSSIANSMAWWVVWIQVNHNVSLIHTSPYVPCRQIQGVQ